MPSLGSKVASCIREYHTSQRISQGKSENCYCTVQDRFILYIAKAGRDFGLGNMCVHEKILSRALTSFN